MERISAEGFPPPPGIINSLKAGFDAIASHSSAILLPLALNLFFWLGPRLRIDAFFNTVKMDVVSTWQTWGMPALEIQKRLEESEKIFPMINVFWLIRTLPIGISSLVFPEATGSTPLGAPLVLQTGPVALFGWAILLTFIGWLGGGLYFRSVALIAIKDNEETPVGILRSLVQTVLLSITFTILSFVIGVPLILFLSIILQLNQFLANIIVLVLSLISMWLIVPLFFWPHGVFVRKQNFILSIITSIQMARFTLPTSSMFILVVFLLTVGLNYLWKVPPENSWMTLFGIFGHAFVTTGLLAASFIYYRDMNVWLQKILERVKASTPSKTIV